MGVRFSKGPDRVFCFLFFTIKILSLYRIYSILGLFAYKRCNGCRYLAKDNLAFFDGEYKVKQNATLDYRVKRKRYL